MSLRPVRDGLLADLDHEMAVTRLVLARVPDALAAWRPHEKSFSLGGLAMHLAVLPRWGCHILQHDAYDLAAAAPRPVAEGTCAEVLETFDRNVADVRTPLAALSDGELTAPWTLTRGNQTIFTMPRVSAIRRFVVHHAVHHRGQLTVYLRLQDVPLPPIYGPSADEVL